MTPVEALQGTIVDLNVGLLKGIVFPGESKLVVFAQSALTHQDLAELYSTGHPGLSVVLRGNGFYAVGRVEIESAGGWFLFDPEPNHLVLDNNLIGPNLLVPREIDFIRNGTRFEFMLRDESMLTRIVMNGNGSEAFEPGEFVLYEVYPARQKLIELFDVLAGSVVLKTSPIAISQGLNYLAK